MGEPVIAQLPPGYMRREDAIFCHLIPRQRHMNASSGTDGIRTRDLRLDRAVL